jgi:hypothetical protein
VEQVHQYGYYSLLPPSFEGSRFRCLEEKIRVVIEYQNVLSVRGLEEASWLLCGMERKRYFWDQLCTMTCFVNKASALKRLSSTGGGSTWVVLSSLSFMGGCVITIK